MNRTLRYGSTGDDVRKLQEGLNQVASSLAKLNVDGVYGAKTTAKAKEFQRNNNLVSDGIVGPLTWTLLLDILSQLLTPPVLPKNQPPSLIRTAVLFVANSQLHPNPAAFDEPVHWAKYESRILEYFQYSAGNTFTKQSALTISWCSYFVHWCLWKANMIPLPHVGGNIPRFLKGKGGAYQEYPIFMKNYQPKPGDMYYLPNSNNHIGFISDVRPAAKGYEIRSIDGNSGPKYGFSKYFDASGKIGGGFIYQPTAWRHLSDSGFYIKLCD
jgi:peptidoglycan hydrolase-like protein with peptidoglycan-binding domain